MAAQPAPVSIRLERAAGRLRVEWPGGLVHRFPLKLLRARCPSAGERADREAAGRAAANPLATLAKVPSHDVTDVRLVGGYAVAFTWGDGHHAGIYRWEYLHELAADPSVETVAPPAAPG